jgi:TRAP-type uncharacterized transport system substrate-binding protein
MHNVKIMIILIIGIFFCFNVYPIQENLITWFLPFYNKGTKELTINTPEYITSNLVYNQLKFEYIKLVYFIIYNKNINNEINNYYNFIISNLIKTKSCNIEKIMIKKANNPEKVLENISNEKDSIGLISSPFLIKAMQTKTELVKNVNSIIIPNYNYIFFITNKNLNISSLEQLNNKKVNIGPANYDSNIFGEDLLKNLETLNNFKIKRYYDTDEIAIEKLRNKEIDGMVFTDLYPSNFLNEKFGNSLNQTFFILPLKNINDELFRKIHPFIKNVAIDLNALSKNYLPIKVNDLEYTMYRPTLDTFQYPVHFICNKNTDPKISYEIVKGIVNNLDILNKSEMTLKNQWNYLTLPDIAIDNFIPTHVGAKIFYNQLTVNTTNPDELCKYYIGKKKCGPEDIESAKIIMGDD